MKSRPISLRVSFLLSSLASKHGLEEAELSAGDWLEESELMDSPPRSEDRNWAAVTIAASARLANRVQVRAASIEVLHIQALPAKLSTSTTDTKVSPIP
jgi:hypothetical protein